MERHIFVTGGIGLLGAALVKELLKEHNNTLILLVRDKQGKSAKERVKAVFSNFYGRNFKEVQKRIKVVSGDITEKHLGINIEARKALVENIDTVYHCAALCNLGESLKVLRKINVEGTRNVLDFALSCHKSGRLKEVHHISTVAIAGKSKGVFREDMLDKKPDFNNAYEQSKFEAEKLVVKYRRKGLDISVFRPTIIVGSSKTGEAANFDMFYQFLRIVSLGIFDEMPINAKCKVNIVPVDAVAKAIFLIAKRRKEKNKAYNIVNSKEMELSFGVDVASNYFGFKRPKLIPLEKYNHKLTNFQNRLIKPYVPYCNHKLRFDSTNSQRILNTNGFMWPGPDKKLLTRLFDYCVKLDYIWVKQ